MLFKFSFDFCLSLRRYHVTKINYRNKVKMNDNNSVPKFNLIAYAF